MIASDELLRVVRRAPPEGFTTSQVAAHFPGAKVEAIASRLSKLAFYGQVDREYAHAHRRGVPRAPTIWCIWHPREAV